jgi:restriction system protein
MVGDVTKNENGGVPSVFELVGPTMQAIRDLGGSGRIEEIIARVAENEGFDDELMDVRRSPEHHMGLIEYRLAWARNYLKNAAAVAQATNETDVRKLFADFGGAY